MQPAIYPRIRSEAEVLCAFGDITGLQQAGALLFRWVLFLETEWKNLQCKFWKEVKLQDFANLKQKNPVLRDFGKGWVLMVASYGCKNSKIGATGDLAERRCTAASLGDFLWDDIRGMRLKWWTRMKKKVTVDSTIAKPMARKASHKKWPQHLFDEFRL